MEVVVEKEKAAGMVVVGLVVEVEEVVVVEVEEAAVVARPVEDMVEAVERVAAPEAAMAVPAVAMEVEVGMVEAEVGVPEGLAAEDTEVEKVVVPVAAVGTPAKVMVAVRAAAMGEATAGHVVAMCRRSD
ncbi:elongation factor Ts family protein [Striga asiatica]|uniref:Elongation factor Ts family protein n=1 Tax=Striga asiatica TaxID=4170 RepID=A0A5A7P3R2_STRAF|nr:elongation factor Ts family protein [Striga asiatica]